MGRYVVNEGEPGEEVRFRFKTDDERRFMDKFWQYFLQSSYLALTKGLGMHVADRGVSDRFNEIKRGAYYKSGNPRTISLEDFRYIEAYADWFDNGETYDEKTFVTPDILEDMEGYAEISNVRRIFRAMQKAMDSDKNGASLKDIREYSGFGPRTVSRYVNWMRDAGIAYYERESVEEVIMNVYTFIDGPRLERFKPLVDKYDAEE